VCSRRRGVEALSRRRGVKEGCDWSSSRACDKGCAKSRMLGIDPVAMSLSRLSAGTCARSRSWCSSACARPMSWAVTPGSVTERD
jgi:hypothetical protein